MNKMSKRFWILFAGGNQDADRSDLFCCLGVRRLQTDMDDCTHSPAVPDPKNVPNDEANGRRNKLQTLTLDHCSQYLDVQDILCVAPCPKVPTLEY